MCSLCHFPRMGMAQFESLFSMLFMKDALSHTPTMLLSQMISFLTFKLKKKKKFKLVKDSKRSCLGLVS